MVDDTLDEYAARPMRYFSHDTDASEDIKCARLIAIGGWEAYGRWWRLCEVLGGIDGHFIRISSDTDMKVAAFMLKFDDVADMVAFLDLLREVGLIAADPEFVYSERMNENARRASAHVRGGKITASKRWK